jgi:hypothetical protein
MNVIDHSMTCFEDFYSTPDYTLWGIQRMLEWIAYCIYILRFLKDVDESGCLDSELL